MIEKGESLKYKIDKIKWIWPSIHPSDYLGKYVFCNEK